MENNVISNHRSTCEQCNNSNLINLKSSVNFTYIYCDHCGYNKEIVLRNFVLDSILDNVKNTLESLSDKLLLNLDVEIFKYDKSIDLFINKVKINSTSFKYNLSEKDFNNFKNTISYLIYDYTDTENISVNFYIK